MSTNWSGYVPVGSGVSVRVGLTLTWSSGTLSWTLQGQVSGGSAYGSDSWVTSGAVATSGTRSWSSSGTFAIASGTKSVPQTASAQTVTMTARLQDVAGTSSDAVVTHSVTVPASMSAPAAPTGVTLTYVSDTRKTVSWTRNATTARPYESMRITRSVNFGAFQTIATLAGSATSFTDTSTVAGSTYRYNVVAQNAAGQAVGTPGDQRIDSTPLVPAAPRATKLASGDIQVTRPTLSASATSWAVKEAGGATLAERIPTSQTTWTHSSPDASRSWAYVVLAGSQSPALTSGWSAASNSISLVQPPLKPSNLAPDVAAADEPITLSWRHNPADGTPQRRYDLAWRTTGSSIWTNASQTSTTPAHTLAAGTWTPGEYEVRVRTFGQHSLPGEWSDILLLTVSSRPVVGITYPTTTHRSQRLTAAWTYHDAEDSVQAGWRARLLTGGQVADTRSGLDTSDEVTFAATLLDGTTYTVSVEVMDGTGLWSDPETVTFTTVFNPPPTPVLHAVWREDEGYTVLSVSVPAPTSGQEPLDHVRIERASEQGWVAVATGLASGDSVTDMIPPTGTVVTYRAVAVSTIGSEAYASVPVDTTTCWLFINYGPGFGGVLRLSSNVVADESFGFVQAERYYAGRTRPVIRSGENLEERYTVTASLWAPWIGTSEHTAMQSPWADVKAAHAARSVACVRDPLGLREFVNVGKPSLSGWHTVESRVSVPLLVIDYVEDVT